MWNQIIKPTQIQDLSYLPVLFFHPIPVIKDTDHAVQKALETSKTFLCMFIGFQFLVFFFVTHGFFGTGYS